MQYPHWLMVAGAVLVVVGFIGLALQKNHAEPAENNLKQAAPTDGENLPRPPAPVRQNAWATGRYADQRRRTSGPNSQRARGRGARDGWRGPRDGRRNAAEHSRTWKVFCCPYSRDPGLSAKSGALSGTNTTLVLESRFRCGVVVSVRWQRATGRRE